MNNWGKDAAAAIAGRKAITHAIGIDPGVNTGLAIWSREIKKFISVRSMPIHGAMEVVIDQMRLFGKDKVFVRLEDARLGNWSRKADEKYLQGAGSIKRDCKIWEDFLIYNKIPFDLIAPAHNKTKVDQAWFSQVTGWVERTNSHGRDAAMLVLSY